MDHLYSMEKTQYFTDENVINIKTHFQALCHVNVSFFLFREKEDLVDLLRDLVGEMGLDCNSSELQDLYSELCQGLKGFTSSMFHLSLK